MLSFLYSPLNTHTHILFLYTVNFFRFKIRICFMVFRPDVCMLGGMQALIGFAWGFSWALYEIKFFGCRVGNKDTKVASGFWSEKLLISDKVTADVMWIFLFDWLGNWHLWQRTQLTRYLFISVSDCAPFFSLSSLFSSFSPFFSFFF